jgi:hypothetical protein
MRRSTVILAMLALCGCSGGRSDGSADIADASPPVVTLSAPSTTIQGGEAVVISVAASDNRDPSVSYTLSCDGGTLAGNILTTAPVTAEARITCRASATDTAGNAGSGTLAVTVQPTVATLKVGEGYSALNGGQVGILLADNLPLAQATYQGTIDGRAVTLTRGLSNLLLYTVPAEVVAGNRQLTLTVGNRTYSFALTIHDTPTVVDAAATVRGFLQSQLAYWTGLTGGELAAMTEAERAEITDGKLSLQNALANLGAQPADEIQDAARYLVANNLVASAGQSGLAYDRDACLLRTGSFVAQALKSSAAKLIGAPGLGIDWLRGLMGSATKTALGAFARQEMAKTRAANTAMRAVCMAPRGIKLEAFNASGQSQQAQSRNVVRALAEAPRYGFSDGKPAYFQAYQLDAMSDDIQDSIRGVVRGLIELFGADPDEYAPERSQLIPSGELSMGAVGHEAVTGSATAVGQLLQLTFEAVGAEEENIDFSFDLHRTNGDVYPVAAQLTLSLPEADPVTLEIRQNSTATQRLVTRGGREVELVDGDPRHGTFAFSGCCNDNFSFTYTPADGFFGIDPLSYRTFNETGYSKKAEILIKVVRDFTGSWNVTVRERVTARSQPNLCGNSDSQGTVTISKISDISYVANYAGIQIPLTHADPLGPAGLVGSLGQDYEEDGGTTHAELSVEVPDSTHLTGRSNWMWRNSNGGTCSGTTEIVGTRR